MSGSTNSPIMVRDEKAVIALQVNKSNLASGFDKAASTYNQQAMIQNQIANYGLSLLEYECQLAQLNGCSITNILDLGCGTAASLARLVKISKHVIGLDLSMSMLRHGQYAQDERMASADSKQHHTHFLNADIESLPFANASIDCIYSSMAMQWCTSPSTVLSEINRVLKPNGRAVLGVLNGESFASLHQAWQTMKVGSRLNEFHSHAEWVKAAKAFAWQIDEQSKCFTSWHRNVLDMLRSIKNIGANTQITLNSTHNSELKSLENAKPFISKEEIKQLTLQCEKMKQAKTGLLGLNYQVSFLTLKKT